MGVDPSSSGRRRRRLAPSEKHELYLQVLTGHATQREAAERWKVDRSTVVHICRVAKQGALDALAPRTAPSTPAPFHRTHHPTHRGRAAVKVVCLTLTNAAAIHHHTPSSSSGARGYTATTHHAGHLTPGDQWRPLPDQPPRTVTDIHRRHGVIVLTDQYAAAWTYPSVIPTAVPDPPHIRTSTTANGGTR